MGDVVEKVVAMLCEPPYPPQPSSPTLTPLNPDGSPALARSAQASSCQGSPCSPHAGTEACALKLSPPSEAASAGGYLPPRRSQLAHRSRLISNQTEPLLSLTC